MRCDTRHPLTRRGLVLLLPLLTLLAGQELRAQESEPDDPFVETVDVNLVNVDVYVTDDQGRRVTDLTPADFEVFEDGRPVEITNFYAVEDRTYRRGSPAAPGPVMDPAEGLDEPSARALPLIELEQVGEVPESQRLHLVIYIDNLNIRPFDRNKVMRELRRFLHDHVTSDDKVMVISFQRTTKIQLPFTSDLREVFDALLEMERDSALRESGDSERQEVLRSIEMARSHSEALSHVELYANSIYNDINVSLDALKRLTGSLAGLPGRKALLHVSSGMPLVAADDLFLLLDRIWPDEKFSGKLMASRYSARRGYRELGARAAASRVTFYTIDATGLRSHGSLSAEYGGRGGNLGDRASLVEVDFARFSNETEPLQSLALDTGGLASFNTNNFFDALDRIGDDFGTYYSLGYLTSHTADGRFHSIDVEVKRKGLEVRHREGFRSRTPEALVNDSTFASLLYDRVSNGLDIEIELDTPRSNGEGDFLVPIQVKVPISRIALIPRDEIHHGILRVSLAVIDEEGRLSPVDQQRIPVDIPGADLDVALGKYYVYTAELLMRKGKQKVAVGVRDDYSGESSFVKRAIEVGG
jgi:VWFA-related protein